MNDFCLILQRASLFGLAALGVALLLQWVLSARVPARWRVWIWRVALIQTALALVPLAPIALAVLPATPVSAPKTVEMTALQAPIQAKNIEDTPAVAASQGAMLPPMEIAPPAAREAPAAIPTRARHSFDFKSSWREFAVWIYLLGVAFQLILLLRNIVRVRRSLNACAPLDNAVLRPIAQRLKIRRLPRLLQCASGSPFLVGVLRPTIVVPQTLNSAHLEAVFAHEMAHHKRRDLSWNALLWALQTALWFHPLSWISRRFHALEVESACDELTLQLTPIAPKSYGALLIGSEHSQTSPLTAGVNDHFFALQTRLKRLNRAPKQPRRRVTWLLGAALLLSFAAAVPLRLTARAQNEAPTIATNRQAQDVSGTVLDASGQPLAGATVYAMAMRPDGLPLPKVKTDSKGQFTLRGAKKGDLDMSVFADAGATGLGERYISGQSSGIKIQLTDPAQIRVRFVDERGRAVPNLGVNLRSVGSSTTAWKDLPRTVYQRFKTTTNARGEATFEGLPQGDVAQFVLADQISKDTIFGMGDLRGTRFAPLATEDAVAIQKPVTRQTIRLLNPVRLEGRVALENGGAKGNVLILARRINAAEAAGKDEKREQLIAQTRSNAQGKYVMDGLRPGRYYVWVYPEKRLVKDYIGPSYERDLKDKTNCVDFQLSRGAIIQGVVTAKNTGKPVKGQTMWLFDSQENNQYVITDARGYFKFRALGGKQRLRVHSNGQNSPPPGFVLPVQSEFNFSVKNGEKRDFRIELPGAAIVQNTKPIRGVVVGPDDKPVAGATVFYYDVSGYNDNSQQVETDAGGQFVVPPKNIRQPMHLFADKGELTTPQGAIAVAGQRVQLKLAANAWASVAGRVLDEKSQPIAGANLNLMTIGEGSGQPQRSLTTDASGAYRYNHLRPDFWLGIEATKMGYTEGSSTTRDLKAGQHVQSDIKLRRAPKTLAGVIYGLDGKPAQNYNAWITGQSGGVKVQKDGRFFFPHVPAGKVQVRVATIKDMSEMQKWKPFTATGGAQNLVLRLSQRQLNPAFKGFDFVKSPLKPETLVGKMAPPIRATQWSGGHALTLSQLREKPVFLVFISPINSIALRDFARSSPDVQVIGVQLKLAGLATADWNLSADETAQRWGFPIAVDATLPSKKFTGWQTFAAYGNAPYVVIGRDGKITYAGDKLNRAIEMATAQ